MSSFLYSTTSNGPPETTGWPCVGVTASFAAVFSSLPLPVANFPHTCSGRIGMPMIWDRALPAGLVYWTTTVAGSGASTCFMFVTLDAQFPAGPFWYLMIVLMVNAASDAVMGFPSDHVVSGWRWKVYVSPSGLGSQLVAQSGTI